ncbi:AAA family ATPase [Paenibacillus sp. FSL P4-0338]|uniref:AAA family ATPase n=1 Tax=unclassified Paenibacillus TaxID=185978 RepID=UPI00267FB691
MFESFNELHHAPFSRDPCRHRALCVCVAGRNARASGLYVAERQCFAVLTGDCGNGKTTTIRRLSEELDEARFKLIYLSNSKLIPRHSYKGLLEQLGCESKFYRGDAKRQLHREIELMRRIHRL